MIVYPRAVVVALGIAAIVGDRLPPEPVERPQGPSEVLEAPVLPIEVNVEERGSVAVPVPKPDEVPPGDEEVEEPEAARFAHPGACADDGVTFCSIRASFAALARWRSMMTCSGLMQAKASMRV